MFGDKYLVLKGLVKFMEIGNLEDFQDVVFVKIRI